MLYPIILAVLAACLYSSEPKKLETTPEPEPEPKKKKEPEVEPELKQEKKDETV